MSGRATWALRCVPPLTIAALLGPVAAGLAGAVFPAFGAGPGGSMREVWGGLFGWPGLGAALRVSVTTGLAATLVSLVGTALIVAGWQGTRAFRWLERLLAPLLAMPHAAAAFGLAFLIAPSGWIARALSPWATGWERPPDLLILQDPAGLAMIAGLVAKETPFLVLMTLAALTQAQSARGALLARTLGYGRVTGWMLGVFPRVYVQIRLPVYVVLAYSMSVVDVAIILGPNTPPPLAVQIVSWMADPDPALQARAAAGALLQLGLVAAVLAFWRGGEWAAGRICAALVWHGWRGAGGIAVPLRVAGMTAGLTIAGAVGLGLAGLALWSVAGFWSFPSALPESADLRTWSRYADDLVRPAIDTALCAMAAASLALALAIACLEAESRLGLRMGPVGRTVLYLPLLVPQIAFMPGLQILALRFGLDGGRGAVIAAHLVFVIPYVFLSLGDPWRAWDRRYALVAAGLGAGPWRILSRVRLPMLLAPVLTALAVGLAVSVGQYLPTLLIGGGRVTTLTTEAVALAAGGDRRAIAVWSLAQTSAAFLPFALALALPRLAGRRPGPQGEP